MARTAAPGECLGQLVRDLGARGVHVLLSNSDASLVHEIYGGDDLRIDRVLAGRNINSRGDRRGKVFEVLVAGGPLAQQPTPIATMDSPRRGTALSLPA